jgi:hypothetical protein
MKQSSGYILVVMTQNSTEPCSCNDANEEAVS